MLPVPMLEQSSDTHRLQFFERLRTSSGREEWNIKQVKPEVPTARGSGAAAASSSAAAAASQQPAVPPKEMVIPSLDPIASLNEVIKAETSRKKKYPPSETGNSTRNYDLFIDLIYQMLTYDPKERIKPDQALNHPFLTIGDQQPPPQQQQSQQSQSYSQKR
jgi:serine/threonine protein kinase